MSGEPTDRAKRTGRVVTLLILGVLVLTVAWCVGSRVTADSRRIAVRHVEQAGGARVDELLLSTDSSGVQFRVLSWNVAHGRGDVGPGWSQNWRGGGREERVRRLSLIADFLSGIDAEVVVLNEVDFRSAWSGGVNQAEFLARAAGYDSWVEQRNVDVELPFLGFAFGNAVLTRFPVSEARWIELPGHSLLEALAVGSKAASVVRLETGTGPVTVIPVHLEPREEATRLEALPVLDSVADTEAPPLILAGDFNSAPPGWPMAGEATVLGELLERGWRSPRALRPPSPEEWTYPTFAPARGLDWILVEPPLDVVEARVLPGAGELSDHAPVLAVIRNRR